MNEIPGDPDPTDDTPELDPMQDSEGVEPDPNSSSNEGTSGRAVDYDEPED